MNGLDRARAVFDAQPFMSTIGAELTRLAPGEAEISLSLRKELTQQSGFAHAGVVTTVLDTAAGIAANTLMPEGADVLSVDFTVHLVRPAVGESVRAVATVVNSGRKITFVRAEAFARGADGTEKLCTVMTATMATIAPAA